MDEYDWAARGVAGFNEVKMYASASRDFMTLHHVSKSALVPNETELSHRWRRRLWQTRRTVSKSKVTYRNGQRLTPAIG
jgi:hypothetical protein